MQPPPDIGQFTVPQKNRKAYWALGGGLALAAILGIMIALLPSGKKAEASAKETKGTAEASAKATTPDEELLVVGQKCPLEKIKITFRPDGTVGGLSFPPECVKHSEKK